jgi:histidine triad (HIT) family protein
MEECLFCNIQQGLISAPGGPLYEDDLVYAHHYHFGEGPTYLGHLLLETKRHTPDFADLTLAEAQAIGMLITCLSSALKACTGAQKVYVVFYGEVIPHLHIHLTARYPNTPAEYLRWNIEDWPDAPQGNVDEIAALCCRLRSTLANSPS